MILILNLCSQIIENYVRVQLVLLPFYAVCAFVIPSRLKIGHQLIAHNILLFGSLLLPILMLLWPVRGLAHQAIISVPIVPVYGAANAVDSMLNSPSCFTFYSFFSIIALVGVLNLGFVLFRQIFHERLIGEQSDIVRTLGKVKVFFSSRIVSPFSTGIWQKKIYLPLRLLDDKSALKPIVAHEIIHIRKNHFLFSMLEKTHRSLAWYNPLSYFLTKRGVELREFLCDTIVRRKYSALFYCKVLLQEAEHVYLGGKWSLVTSFHRKSLLKRRVLMMSGQEISRPTWGILAASTISFFASMFALAAIGSSPGYQMMEQSKQQEAQETTQAIEDELHAIINDDLSYIVEEIRSNAPSALLPEPYYKLVDLRRIDNSRLFYYSASVDFYYLKDIKAKQIRKYRYSPLQKGWYRYYKKLAFDFSNV